VTPQLGPDATGVGWAFMYVLNSPDRPLDELRSLQDWYLRYGLMSVEGVSEVASLGGFVRQYQVEVDPVKLRAYDIPLQPSNARSSAPTTTSAEGSSRRRARDGGTRSRLHQGDPRPRTGPVVGLGAGGTPVLLRDVARINHRAGDPARSRRVER
jgi:Cu(I)/Ag(I) efflux system membrane protein CusA/SilA